MKKLYVGVQKSTQEKEAKVSPIVVVDVSGSMGSYMNDINEFLKIYAQKYPDFTLIEFGTDVHTYMIREGHVPTLTTKGSTNSIGAVETMAKEVKTALSIDPKGVVPVIWISDGQANVTRKRMFADLETVFDEVLEEINKFDQTFSPQEMKRVMMTVVNYGNRADTRIALRLKLKFPASNFIECPVNELAFLKAQEVMGIGQAEAYSLFTDGKKLYCRPSDVEKKLKVVGDQLLLQPTGVLGGVAYPDPGTKTIFCLADQKPEDTKEVSWRAVRMQDSGLLEQAVQRIRQNIIGSRYANANDPSYKAKILASFKEILSAVSLLASQAAEAQRAPLLEKPEGMSWQEYRKICIEQLKEKMKPDDRGDRTLVSVVSSLLNGLDDLFDLDKQARLDKVNKLASSKLHHTSMARQRKYDVTPIDNFLKHLSTEGNVAEIRRYLEALRSTLPEDENESIMSLATNSEWIDCMLQLLEDPIELDAEAAIVDLIKKMFESAFHVVGRAGRLNQENAALGFGDSMLRKMYLDSAMDSSYISASDALLRPVIPARDARVTVNALYFLQNMHITAFLKRFNMDTILASLILKDNPLADASDALALQILGLDAILDQLEAEKAPHSLFIYRMLRLANLIAYRGKATIEKVAFLDYDREGEENLRQKITNFKPRATSAFMLTLPLGLPFARAKDFAYESLMASFYLAKRHEERFAGQDIRAELDLAYDISQSLPKRYLLRKALQENIGQFKPVTLSFKKDGQVKIEKQESVIKLYLHAPDGTLLESQLVPYGADLLVEDGDMIKASQNLISFDAHKDQVLGGIFHRAAGFDQAETDNQEVEYVSANFPVERIKDILNMSPEVALRLFVQDIMPAGAEIDSAQFMTFMVEQASNTDRASLPRRVELPKYLEALDAIAKDTKTQKALINLNDNPEALSTFMEKQEGSRKTVEGLVGMIRKARKGLEKKLRLNWADYRDGKTKLCNVATNRIVSVMKDDIFRATRDPSAGFEFINKLFYSTKHSRHASLVNSPELKKTYIDFLRMLDEHYGADYRKALFLEILSKFADSNPDYVSEALQLLVEKGDENQTVIEVYAQKGFAVAVSIPSVCESLAKRVTEYLESEKTEKLHADLISSIKARQPSLRKAMVETITKEGQEYTESLCREHMAHLYKVFGSQLVRLDTFKTMTATHVFSIIKTLHDIGIYESIRSKYMEGATNDATALRRYKATIPEVFRAYLSRATGTEELVGYREFVQSREYTEFCKNIKLTDIETLQADFPNEMEVAPKGGLD